MHHGCHRVLVLAAILVFGSQLLSQTLIRSAQSGSWSNPSTWVGGKVPGDQVFVEVDHTVTIDQSIGTVSGGGIFTIRIGNNAALCVGNGGSCSPATTPLTITFASTGTDPIGGGSATNPGVNATASGFFVSYGTLDLEGSSARNSVTIQTSNGTSPWYIHHGFSDYSGCTTISITGCSGGARNTTHPVTIKLRYVNGVGPIGTPTAHYEGVSHDFNSSTGPNIIDLQFNRLMGLRQITTYDSNGASPIAITLAYNYFLNPTGYATPSYTIELYGTVTPGATITDNTEVGAAMAGSMVAAINGASGMIFKRNAILGSALVQRGLLFLNASNGTNNIIQNNLMVDPEGSAAAGIPGISFFGASASDASSLIDGNILQGNYEQIDVFRGSPAQTNNWMSLYYEAAQQGNQGAIIARNGTATAMVRNNIFVQENDNFKANVYLYIPYTSGATCSTSVGVDHNVFYLVPGSTGQAHVFGDGGTSSGLCIVSSYARSNIAVNGRHGFTNTNGDNVWDAALHGGGTGAGVHHNATFNQATALTRQPGRTYLLNQATTPQAGNSGGYSYVVTTAGISGTASPVWPQGIGKTVTDGTVVWTAGIPYTDYFSNPGTGSGWDNGSIPHPNKVQYGDVQADPNFLDVTRRPAAYDTVCRGPGTTDSLFANLSYRSGFGGSYNNCYDIPKLLAWLMNGWSAQNPALAKTAHDGTDIGAVPVTIKKRKPAIWHR